MIGNMDEIVDWLIYPTSCYYYFWSTILFGLFILLVLTLYFRERDRETHPDIISNMGVSSMAIIFLSLILTLMKNSDGIPVLQSDLFIYHIVFGLILILIWIFKK